MITFNPAYNNLNFKSYQHAVLNKYGAVVNRGDTCLFRWDLDSAGLIKYLEKKYAGVDKVNLIAHASSVGEEVYSFIAVMLNMLGSDKAMKYLPVKAFDKEQHFVDIAKRGEYTVKSFEKGAIDYYLGSCFNNYFDYLDVNRVKVRSEFQNLVKFFQSDILEDVKNINFDNTVLFARNFWHYLDEEDIYKLAMNLSHRMNKSSTLIIGDFDKQFNIDRILNNYGFKESGTVGNVFENFK